MDKKAAIFLISFTVLLGMSTIAAAATISLPNPLCPNPLPAGSTCINSFPLLITTIINFLVGLIASLAVLLFVWAGILFVTAGADPSNVQKAKHAVMYGVIGLAIALAGTGLVAVIQGVIGVAPGSVPDGGACTNDVDCVSGSCGSVIVGTCDNS